jgi:hypothetical protein
MKKEAWPDTIFDTALRKFTNKSTGGRIIYPLGREVWMLFYGMLTEFIIGSNERRKIAKYNQKTSAAH